MVSDQTASPTAPEGGGLAAALPRILLAPLPLFPLQPVLGHIVRRVSRTRPELYARLGPHGGKTFLIDPLELPFALLLRPDPAAPLLRAVRRHAADTWDARIAGDFLSLLDVIDGRVDPDALFFTRDLTIEGDTEAAVCLHRAIDDLDGSLAEDVAAIFGPPGLAALALLRRLRATAETEDPLAPA